MAFETQNELLSSPKSRFHPEMTDRQSFFAEKVPNAIKECNARKSLAWDREFFTSPGVCTAAFALILIIYRIILSYLDI